MRSPMATLPHRVTAGPPALAPPKGNWRRALVSLAVGAPPWPTSRRHRWGVLGMGEEYYPMPWSKPHYDPDLGGYRVAVTEDQLRGAPKFSRSTDWDWSNRTNDERVYKYYNQPLWY